MILVIHDHDFSDKVNDHDCDLPIMMQSRTGLLDLPIMILVINFTVNYSDMFKGYLANWWEI